MKRLPLPKCGRSRRLVAVVLFFAASLAFSLLAFYSPVKSLPSPATCTIEMTAASCQYVLAQSKAQIAAAQFPFWLYRSYAETSEGLAVVAMLLLLYPMKRAALSLSHPVTLSKPMRRLAFSISLAGAVAFLVMVGIDVSYAQKYFPSLHDSASTALSYFHFYALQPQGSALGSMAVLAATVATLGFMIYHLEKGLPSAFAWALRRFTLPAIITLQVLLLVSDPSEMPVHVTNFASWSLGGVAVLSNWFVLIVALFLTLLGYAPSLLLSS